MSLCDDCKYEPDECDHIGNPEDCQDYEPDKLTQCFARYIREHKDELLGEEKGGVL